MSEILLPPVDLSIPNLNIKYEPCDSVDEDLEIFKLISAKKNELSGGLKGAGSWYRAGNGPAPTQGGKDVAGASLTPLTSPPSTSIVTSVYYTYDNTHYGGWSSSIQVKSWIGLPSGARWSADVTSANTGTLSTAGLNIPAASAFFYFTMKVGNLVVTLYNPPYISTDSVTVYYSY